MEASGWSAWPVAGAAGRWRCCPPFAVPYKRYAAGVIGGFLHAVLREGQTLSELEREAGITRQTGACWLRQFGQSAIAHLQVHLPQLASVKEFPPLVPASVAASTSGPGLASAPARMVRVWSLLLALAAQFMESVPVAERPVPLLEWLQPELARLRPAAGVFRVPLYERARGPPASRGV
jgi:hypothetical protein